MNLFEYTWRALTRHTSPLEVRQHAVFVHQEEVTMMKTRHKWSAFEREMAEACNDVGDKMGYMLKPIFIITNQSKERRAKV